MDFAVRGRDTFRSPQGYPVAYTLVFAAVWGKWS